MNNRYKEPLQELSGKEKTVGRKQSSSDSHDDTDFYFKHEFVRFSITE